MSSQCPLRHPVALSRKNACPFCGQLATSLIPATPGRGFQVECLNCGARGPAGAHSPDDATRAWDYGDGFFLRRHIDPQPSPGESLAEAPAYETDPALLSEQERSQIEGLFDDEF